MKKRKSTLHRLYHENSNGKSGRKNTIAELKQLYMEATEKYPDGTRNNRTSRLYHLARTLHQRHPNVFKKQPSIRLVYEWLVFLKVYRPKWRTIHLPDPDHSAVFALTMRRTTSKVTDEQYELFRWSLSFIIQPEHKFRRWPRHTWIKSSGQGATVLDVTCDHRLSTWFACSERGAAKRKQRDRMLADVEAIVFHNGKGLVTQEAVNLLISNIRKSLNRDSGELSSINYAIRLIILPTMYLIQR